MSEPSASDLEFKDIIVWHRPSFAVETLEAAERLAVKSGKPVIVLGPDETIESLSKDEMKTVGFMPVSEHEELRATAQEVVDVAAAFSTLGRYAGLAGSLDALRAVLAAGQQQRRIES